jgi:uncharacterized RDD family membrane protein YckC
MAAMSTPDPTVAESPALWRRVVARAIDMTLMSFVIVGVHAATGSYLLALTLGYSWWSLTDWAGSTGKWVVGLRAVGADGQPSVSALQSVARNLPWLAMNLPHRFHQGLLGLDRATYRATHSTEFIVLGALEIAVLIALVASLDDTGRHFADRMAGTKVVRR